MKTSYLFRIATISVVRGLLAVVAINLLMPNQALGVELYSIPTQGLVGWWRGEGNANDSVGAHNGTTPYGMGYPQGMVGQSFFNQTGYQRVLIPDGADFKLTDSLTIVQWIYPLQNTGVVFYRGDSRPGWDPYSIGAFTLNKINFTICGSSGETASVEAAIQYNVWQQVAAVLDGSTGSMRLYVNGTLGGEFNTAVRPFADLNAFQNPTVAIGGVDINYTLPFAGKIDEVALYSRALSASEIGEMYSSVVPEPSIFALTSLGCAALFLRDGVRKSINKS